MKAQSLPKPLQAALVTTAVLTAIALLKPDAVDAPLTIASDALTAPSLRHDTRSARHVGTPWIRSAGEPWKAPDVDPQKSADAEPPPSLVPLPAPVIDTPKPTAPDPTLIYLGQLEQDGRRYVFLGRGADPQVVEIGGLVDAQWKVEQVTATAVRLRYLPLNEVRSIPVAAAMQ